MFHRCPDGVAPMSRRYTGKWYVGHDGQEIPGHLIQWFMSNPHSLTSENGRSNEGEHDQQSEPKHSDALRATNGAGRHRREGGLGEAQRFNPLDR